MIVPHEAVPERKVPVIVRPGRYTVSLERTSGLTLVHCSVHTWSPSISRSLKADWKAFLNLHDGPLLALHTPGDRKHLHFLRIFGFEYLTSYHDAALDADRDIFIVNKEHT